MTEIAHPPLAAAARRDALHAAFARAFDGRTPDVIVRAPGRANLLGGHVDMHGGLVISGAIDREIWIAAARGAADRVNLHALDLAAAATFTLDALETHTTADGQALDRWAAYPAGMAWALTQRAIALCGMDGLFGGDVVMRAGLSSSAAVEMGFAVAWQALAPFTLPLRELALAGVDVERQYLGLGTGVQDQFTCLHGRRDHALLLDCRSLEYEALALPDSVRVVICDTATRRELANGSSRYNTRADDAHAAARIIAADDPAVQTLRDVSPDRLAAYADRLSPAQFQRARHVVTENARVKDGAAALRTGDVRTFGALMNASYRSARDDYGSSSPALDAMWQAATAHPACYGARMTGGGGGGALVALVEASDAGDFMTRTAQDYARRSGQHGQFFVATLVDGACVVNA